MNALTCQCIQIGRQCSNKCLTFTGFHLGNSALMKDDSTYELYPEVLHSKNSLGGLTYNRISLRHDIIKSLAVCKSLLEFLGLTS